MPVDEQLIDDVKARFRRREYEFSRHAAEQALVRDVSTAEIEQAMSAGELVEDYPDDKYGPSLLVLGWTDAGRPLHLHCSYPTRPIIRVITVYEPDPQRWIDYRERKP